uniref:Uncharacterized protein n=1 Tax=Haptolina brevifila TaxID=156173 RepID=A0A7S2H5M0_9EUKA|mmetsp:Transcript_51447/g.102400  ORF Transcript_51447/g.102400 Transcript_51447/m.102400 type:complete len:297 (+) Transcript_51447:51-941(+)
MVPETADAVHEPFIQWGHHHRGNKCSPRAALALFSLGLTFLTGTLMLNGTSVQPSSLPETDLWKHWNAPTSAKRCDWVVAHMVAKQKPGSTHEELVKKYALQSLDAGTFYRATAHLFWQDFVRGGWGNFDISELGIHTTLADGSPIQRTSTWTWITGDQHLSNFGAYMNRQRNVVFDVNDFDEAIIFDFQMDVWRVAVSICNHALMNGLRDAEALASVLTFTDVYISTVQGYLDNDFAQDRELTAKTSKGELARFLKSKQDNHEQQNKLMAKFTERDPTTQQPRLVQSLQHAHAHV